MVSIKLNIDNEEVKNKFDELQQRFKDKGHKKSQCELLEILIDFFNNHYKQKK